MRNFLTAFVALSFVALCIPSFANSLMISNTKTLSKSAQHLQVTFNVSDENAGCYANVYDGAWPNRHLVHATITAPDGARWTRMVDAAIDLDALALEKHMVIECSASSGTATMRHKIPAPPEIRMNSEITPLEGGNVRFKADAYVDNHEPDGACYSYQYPASFNLLGSDSGISKQFFADYFVLDKNFVDEIQYHAHVAVICQNSGGISILNHVWEDRDGVLQLVSSIREYH